MTTARATARPPTCAEPPPSQGPRCATGTTRPAGHAHYAWQFQTPREMLQAVFRAEHFIQGNVCCSHALFDQVGGYDGELQMAEDLDLYVRFILAGHLPVVCTHISHLHRFHASNVSIGVNADKHNTDLRVTYEKYGAQLEALVIGAP